LKLIAFCNIYAKIGKLQFVKIWAKVFKGFILKLAKTIEAIFFCIFLHLNLRRKIIPVLRFNKAVVDEDI